LIDFRYHIVSLIAVFLALALGLFLGSTTLQSTVTDNLHKQADRVTSANKRLRADNSQLDNQLKAERNFTQAVVPYAVSDRLTGETVAVVSTPGVDGGAHASVLSTLAAAGATVTLDVTLQSNYLDPTEDTQLGDLATAAAKGTPLPAGAGAGKASSLLARALVVRPGRRFLARLRVATILNTLAAGKFIKVSGSAPARPADLVVLLVPPASSSAVTTQAQTKATAQNTILTSLAADLRSSATGAVVAGPAPVSGTVESALAAVRANQSLATTLSTVDLDVNDSLGDPAVGRVAIVLALANSANRLFGAYGVTQKPPLPTPAATP
jgi:Copper transport outer membrane protein, MctB